MAAGQRKYKATELTFVKDGADVRCNVAFSYGIEEVDGMVNERRPNTVALSKEDLVALLTPGQRQAIAEAFAAIQTAIKTRIAALATAVEE